MSAEATSRALNRLAWQAELLQRVLPHAQDAEEAEAAVMVALSIQPDPPDDVEAALSWEPAGVGPSGIPRWKDTATGRYRYQQTRPGSRKGAPNEPGGIKPQPKADIPGRQAAGAPPEPQGLAPKPPEPPGRPRQAQVKSPALAKGPLPPPQPVVRRGQQPQQPKPSLPPPQPVVRREQQPKTPAAPPPAQPQITPEARKKFADLQTEQKKSLDNPNSTLNRRSDQLEEIRFGEGPVVRTVVSTPEKPLSSQEHQDVSAHHARYGGMAQLMGNKALAEAHFTAAQYHNELGKKKAGQKQPGAPAAPPQAPAPAQAPTAPAQSPARQKVAGLFLSALEKTQGLSDATKQEYANATSAVLSRVPDKAVERLTITKGVRYFKDQNDLTAAFMQNLPSDEARAQWEGNTIGGFYNPPTGELGMDGSSASGAFLGEAGTEDVEGTYAHEITHAIDGPTYHLSRSEEWKAIFSEEINKSTNPLSAYARTNAQEGFAEFGQAVYGSKIATAKIERRCPKAVAYWKKLGIWPTNR